MDMPRCPICEQSDEVWTVNNLVKSGGNTASVLGPEKMLAGDKTALVDLLKEVAPSGWNPIWHKSCICIRCDRVFIPDRGLVMTVVGFCKYFVDTQPKKVRSKSTIHLLVKRLLGLYKSYQLEGLEIGLDKLKTIKPLKDRRVVGVYETDDRNPECRYKDTERVDFGVVETAEELMERISEYQLADGYFTIRHYPGGDLEFSRRWIGFEVY